MENVQKKCENILSWFGGEAFLNKKRERKRENSARDEIGQFITAALLSSKIYILKKQKN